ncbi:MAG: DNA-protecting protein DprA, partial [Thermoanaerobaculia bacterium]|nr:DNA-protecting protein DprA [Thermoanaerobaculia bacterium]
LQALPEGAPRTADDLAAAVDKPVDRVLAALLELELSGWIERQPGPVYLRLSASP